MSDRCWDCGEEIEFYTTADGSKKPYHVHGGPCRGKHAVPMEASVPTSTVTYSPWRGLPWVQRYESYTNPNARCPECRACVFFYQSPNGGRVFFDALGPPWPKHPCTDRIKPEQVVEPLFYEPNADRIGEPVDQPTVRAEVDADDSVIAEPVDEVEPLWMAQGWEPFELTDEAAKDKGVLYVRGRCVEEEVATYLALQSRLRRVDLDLEGPLMVLRKNGSAKKISLLQVTGKAITLPCFDFLSDAKGAV